jgi:aspartyl-tRNA(Asn)/glutamyl-tRNA(Gln) amidotransferase subunit B
VAYAKELHKIVTWIGICDGNMQEGSFRCDANVSVRKPGAALGTRREIKNLNSFRFMQQAIDYEVRWQIEQIEDGHAIQQATVLFNPDTGETRAMRSKEDAADYRYFPDPDLPPLVIDPAWVERVRAEMVELPWEMAARFVRDYEIPEKLAEAITTNRGKADFFQEFFEILWQELPDSEACIKGANWAMVEISARLNASGIQIQNSYVGPGQLAALVIRVAKGDISHSAAKSIFDRLWEKGLVWAAVSGKRNFFDVDAEIVRLIDSSGLRQMNDSGALEGIVDTVIAANAQNVAEYRAGNAKALNALVGQIMKGSAGKANPQQVNALLKAKLG